VQSDYTYSSDDEDFQHMLPPQAAPGISYNDGVYVQQSLAQYSFTDHDLITHLQQSRLGDATQTALDDVYQKRGEIDKLTMFEAFTERHDKLYDGATYEVYEVDRNGVARPKHAADDNDANLILDVRTVWDTIKVQFSPINLCLQHTHS
jgi:hypothetical protein